MTTAATCTTRDVPWSASFYSGEQFDPDLGLYYLRARYYNPATGRFMSRDPEDHALTDIKELHKYLYADGDPVNAFDPTGKGLIGYTIRFVRTYWAEILWAKGCGLAIYDLYSTIGDALENAYGQPGHKYVPEWKVISKVAEVYGACAGPAIIKLFKSYF